MSDIPVLVNRIWNEHGDVFFTGVYGHYIDTHFGINEFGRSPIVMFNADFISFIAAGDEDCERPQ